MKICEPPPWRSGFHCLASDKFEPSARSIIMLTRTTRYMAMLMIPKFTAGGPAQPPIWRRCTPAAIKMSALSAAFAILLLLSVSCGGCPATPSVSSISPNSATAGGSGFVLTVNGGNFSSYSVVVWNGTAQTTSFVSGSQLTAEVSSTNIAGPDTAVVYVYNPPAGSQTVGVGSIIPSNSNSCSAQGSNSVSFSVSP